MPAQRASPVGASLAFSVISSIRTVETTIRDSSVDNDRWAIVQSAVRRRREKVGQGVRDSEIEEQCSCVREAIAGGNLFIHDARQQFRCDDIAAVVETRAVVNPLPDLRA